MISADIGVSESASYRHVRNHMVPGVLRAARTTDSSVDIDAFADRLVANLADIEDVRKHARATSDGRLLLAACQQERETISFLVGRLGIDSEQMLADFKEARALSKATREVASEYPDAIQAIAEVIRFESGGLELADAITSYLDREVYKRQKELTA